MRRKKLYWIWHVEIWWFCCAFFPYCVLITAKECHNATGRCFWIANASATTWVNSRTLCQQDRGDLAVMETEELRVFATDRFKWVITSLKLSLRVFISEQTEQPQHIRIAQTITHSLQKKYQRHIIIITDQVSRSKKITMLDYRTQTKFGAKVMFFHLSVSHSVHRGVYPSMQWGWCTPLRQTPHPRQTATTKTPPWAGTSP